jgi:HlyD family secretion protein
MDNPIFRKAALERLASPERLDNLMQVTSVKGWLSLYAIGFVVIAAVIWGILGRSPDTVQGVGIMLRQGGLYGIQATGSGPVAAVDVKSGSEVRAGEVVARIAQPGLELSIARIEAELAALRRNRAEISRGLDRSTAIDVSALNQQHRQLTETIAQYQERIRYLDQRVTAEEKALKLGLITADVYQNSVAQRAQAKDALVGAQVQLEQLGSREVSLKSQAAQQIFTLDSQLRDAEGQLAVLRQQYGRESEVHSPYDGVVVEQLVDIGEAVAPGQSLLTIEFLNVPLQVLFFSVDGKRITPGMRVQLIPAGIRPEENGYMLGRVRSVSQTPLSATAMNRYLRNEALVRTFTGQGGAYLVDVQVERDPTTVSGFRWTTRKGPAMRLGSGALLTGSITVHEQAPITLVVPALRKWFGV